MIYRISWDADAVRELEWLWDHHDDPSGLASSLDEIHGTLSEDAHDKGESRARGLRVLLTPPLGVEFHAQLRLGEVLIVRVWLIRHRP
jgi:hypothetical protein